MEGWSEEAEEERLGSEHSPCSVIEIVGTYLREITGARTRESLARAAIRDGAGRTTTSSRESEEEDESESGHEESGSFLGRTGLNSPLELLLLLVRPRLCLANLGSSAPNRACPWLTRDLDRSGKGLGWRSFERQRREGLEAWPRRSGIGVRMFRFSRERSAHEPIMDIADFPLKNVSIVIMLQW